MEPDVVMAQGDTCELCYLAHVLPIDVARSLDDGFTQVAAVASEVAERLVDLFNDAVEPSPRCMTCRGPVSAAELRAQGATCDECYEAVLAEGRRWLSYQ
jgi:hypothetical protein